MAIPLTPVTLGRFAATFRLAEPFPHIVIDNFIDTATAQMIAAEYPTFENARALGFSFSAVNERKKIQITDRDRFPPTVRRLNDFLASPAFLADLSALTGIPNLLADDHLLGGGMHITGPHGRLDVHLDFNRGVGNLYRRLNLLLYLNPEWNESWGGQVELWDTAVKHCHVSLAPVLARCVIFETSEISFHGVAPLKCPADHTRRSFATYYYTKEPPPQGEGMHGTIFRARPDEKLRQYVLMPAEQFTRGAANGVRRLTARARRAAGRVRRRLAGR
jgi:2-oxoglutarate-Fe(II)-dependent oxygenase superfamily protein